MASVSFTQQEAHTIMTVDNAFSTAKISSHGACVLSFIPKVSSEFSFNTPDLLWVSPTANFDGQAPVRGGIPICWPWFGKHANTMLPAHGFVRNRIWQLDKIRQLESGETALVFGLESSEETLRIWPYQFRLTLTITIGKSLSLSLCTENLSGMDMVITEAFHSYFNVHHAPDVQVLGLQGSLQVDTLNKMQKSVQKEVLSIPPSIDSVFLNHISEAVIAEAELSHRICISKQNSASTVVWNPGVEIVKGFKDIPDKQWSEFLCVESGNVFENTVTLTPSEKHTLNVQFSYLF